MNPLRAIWVFNFCVYLAGRLTFGHNDLRDLDNQPADCDIIPMRLLAVAGPTSVPGLQRENIMLTYKFDFQKTLQAAALLLRAHHNRMEYIRLLKLLYIADRELLAKIGRTLTGDQAIAMKRGPVLTTVYDLIKGKGSVATNAEWATAIRTEGYEVTLSGDVGTNRLTKAEAIVLEDVCLRYRDTDSEGPSDLTHEFREWAEVFDESRADSSPVIDWATALAAQGKGELIEEARRMTRERQAADTAFGG